LLFCSPTQGTSVPLDPLLHHHNHDCYLLNIFIAELLCFLLYSR